MLMLELFHCSGLWRRLTALFCCVLLLCLVACNVGGNSNTGKGSAEPVPAAEQTLRFPLVGTMNLATLDPAREHGYNETVVMNMLYSGLVRSDEKLNVVPDQATWQLSADGLVYTFTLRPGIAFSDGTPVTAQAYSDSWTRALRKGTASSVLSLLSPIVGASEVRNGQAQTLTGAKALNDTTLQVTLTKPTAYFLAALTNALFFPLNQKLVARYDQEGWPQAVPETGLGTGPLIMKAWQPAARLVFAPNPHYYGRKTALTTVVASFVNDPRVAFKIYGVGQTDLVWNITPTDQLAARSSAGFTRAPLLQTDALFVGTKKPPFDVPTVRQAFARAIDRNALMQSAFNGAYLPSATLQPPGMPAYHTSEQGMSYDAAQARSLLHQTYPDASRFPAVTFSYPAFQLSEQEATTLQDMWQSTLGVQVNLRAVEPQAYEQEMKDHLIQLGFVSLRADFPDPYALLSPFLPSADSTKQLWQDTAVEQIVAQAGQQEETARRVALYSEAEARLLSAAVLIPLDHPMLAGVIPPQVHGILLNGQGLYFGDWSNIYLSRKAT